VDIGMKKHVPSYIKIEGHRALIAYEGQPMTCCRCNEQGHQQHECPRRRTSASYQTNQSSDTWANVVQRAKTAGLPTTNLPTSEYPVPPVKETLADTD